MEKKESMSSEPSKELFNALGVDHIHETDDCNLCTMSRVMQPIIEMQMRNKIVKQIVDYYSDTELSPIEKEIWQTCAQIAMGIVRKD